MYLAYYCLNLALQCDLHGNFAMFFALQADQVMITDMWSKAESIMKDVYGKIVGISTIAAIVTGI